MAYMYPEIHDEQELFTSDGVLTDSVVRRLCDLELPLIANYLPPIMVGRTAVAEELVQETIFALSKIDLSNIEGFADLKALFCTIAQRVTVNYQRAALSMKRGGKLQRHSLDHGDGNPIDVPDRNSGCKNRLINALVLSEALDTLANRYRTVFLAKSLHGFSFAEMADLSGLGKRQIQNIYNDALALLRRSLAGYENCEV